MLSIEIMTTIIILAVLCAILLIAATTILYLYLKKKNPKNAFTVKLLSKQLKTEQAKLIKARQVYEESYADYNTKLSQLDFLDKKILEHDLIKLIKKERADEIQQSLIELNEHAKLEAANILVNSMQNLAGPIIQENSLGTIKLEDENMKGKIIGKDGRNKKVFELLTGTDLIIEKENSYISVSSHNPIRKTIGTLVLSELIRGKVIEPSRIETVYADVASQFNSSLVGIGKNIIENELKISDLPTELYEYVGRLKYRGSYGQNSLEHSIETARIANYIAMALDLDNKLATKCGLLHDIGKSIDYEINENHVTAGIKIVKDLKLHPAILNAIESHHGSVKANNIYSEIIKLADTISAARPGARIDSFEEYIERVQRLEKIVTEFEAVNYAYAIKSGRQLRVIVNPIKVLDNDLEALAKAIKTKLETDELISGYNIKVVVIKENRYEFETDVTKHL